MRRTKLRDRQLPDYTHAEEVFNMVTHIVGGGLGIVVLTLCVIFSALHHDPWAVVGSAVYGTSMIALYSISSIYHGLSPAKETAKKVMQVIDHCTIYFLIAGTYTPIVLTAIRRENAVVGWVLFGVVWGLAALATTLTAIDLKKYSVFSMICYIGMGWCIVFTLPVTLRALTVPGFSLLLAGGIAYTIGAILYGLGRSKRFMHSVFHIFVILGSLLQFFAIFFYVI
jgi:hemolysin III